MKLEYTPTILIVDDEEYICDVIKESLSDKKYNLVAFHDPAKALEYLQDNPVDLVLSDLIMDKYSGEKILEEALDTQDDVVVIIMTAHPTVKMAISVLKKGAYDFLVKPFKLELLKSTIQRALVHQQVLRDNVHLRSQVKFLKVANAHTSGVEIERLLEMVVDSCKNELGASAAGLLEIDPKSEEQIRQSSTVDDPSMKDEVLNIDSLKKFVGTWRPKPIIEGKRVKQNGHSLVKITIYQPIFIRRTLHGVISLIIESHFGHVTSGQLDVLSILTNTAASAIANHILYQNLQQSYLEAIRGLANAIEARDKYTAGHTDRVTIIAERMAEEMGWDEDQIHDLTMGCTLHDIGKIGVPDSILNKPSVLTQGETKKMQKHPELGLKIIRGISLFKPAEPYIGSHHERWDGAGYPKQLKGKEIPIEGRLLAVVDTFDAIMSDRPYRKGADIKSAIQELIKYSGIQFDKEMVDIFLRLIRRGAIDLKTLYDRDEEIEQLDEIIVSETVSV
ncbi:MAG: response regulator [candidate division Zixibacteria bacterium]|nr:response regulator [candidate division Zixibacteria bacterium]